MPIGYVVEPNRERPRSGTDLESQQYTKPSNNPDSESSTATPRMKHTIEAPHGMTIVGSYET